MAAPAQGIDGILTRGELQRFVEEQVLGDLPQRLQRLGGKVTHGVYRALPTDPVDGDIAYYLADDTNGVVWAFKYRAASASASKWEFVGGAPLTHEVATDETRANVAYGDLATVGPTLTVPLAGDYEIVGAAEGFIGATGNSTLVAAVKLGAAATADAETVSWQGTVGSAGAGVQGSMGSRTLRRNGLAASDVVKLQYKASAGTGHWLNRTLAIRPVRVT